MFLFVHLVAKVAEVASCSMGPGTLLAEVYVHVWEHVLDGPDLSE